MFRDFIRVLVVASILCAGSASTYGGEPPVVLTKQFIDDPVGPGETVTLEFTLTNPSATTTATGITFTDDLATVLAGLTANLPPTPDPPCGPGSTLTGSAGDTFLTLAGGTLAPGASCSFSVTLNVPVGAAVGTYTNTTSSVTASTGTGASASDNLDVTGLKFTKEFLGDPVFPGETLTLRFTLENVHPTDAYTVTFFTDNLAANLAGLAATGGATMDTVGGVLSGTTFLIYTGGSVASGSTGVIEVEVAVPAAAPTGSYVNTTSSLIYSGGIVPPATDNLDVAPPPAFTKAFAPDTIFAGGTSTLTFTVDNSGSASAATSLTFTDVLPAGVVVAPAPNVMNTLGGTVTAVAGTGTISLTGGSIGGSSSGTVEVDVTSSTIGSHVNVSGALTSTGGNSGTATDTLTVNPPPPTFTKVFGPDPIFVGGISTLTFTVDNTASGSAATSLDFTDNLPAGVVVAATPNASTTLTGGTITAAAGSGTISYTGGTIGAMASGTLQVDVTSSTPGAHVNLSGDLTSSAGNSGTATDTLTVNPVPLFSKAFAPDPIFAGGTSTLTFTVDNTASTAVATALDFTDNLPAGVVISPTPNVANTLGGTVTAVAGSGTISLTGGSIGAGASGTVQVDVTAGSAGSFVNTSGDLTSNAGNSGTATDTLTVNPLPLFSKAFAPDTIAAGGTSTLTFTVDNTASTAAATALDFTDSLPAGVVVASPSNASSTLTGGTLTAVPGTGTISFTGGSIGAGASGTVQVDVTSSTAGAFVNVTGDLTSSAGNSGTATDTLTVNPPPAFSKAFAPDTTLTGLVSTLTFTVDNTASTVAATSLDFTDNLPAGLVVATPPNASTTLTGGTITAVAGTGVISYSGGTLNAGASGTIQVDVTSNTPGTYVNTTGDLTSSAGNSGTATDTLVINPSNVPPVIHSSSLMPNPLAVATDGTFTVNATDADGDTLTFTWDFGDGTTGTGETVMHAYAAVGTYTATVTVDDGQGGVATATLVVSVVAGQPVAGIGPDTDGDGFSDSLETFLGTDPSSSASTPLGIGPLAAAELAFVKSLRVTLNLRPQATGKDRIRLLGDLPVPDGFSFAGQVVVLDVGGVQLRFTLNAKGRGKDGRTRIRFERTKLGFSRVRVARGFVGDYKGTLAMSSALDNANVPGEPRTVRVTMLFNNQAHVSDVTMPYTATQNVRGTAKAGGKAGLPDIDGSRGE